MKQIDNKLSLSRRFSRWNYLYEEEIGRVLLIFFIALCIITCVMIHNDYGYEVNNYDATNYEYLTTTINSIWDENTKSLNLGNLPDNVSITDAEFSSSKIDFKCSLETGNIIVSDPFIEVHISDNFDVEITYHTQSEYVGSARADFVLFYVLWCFLCIVVEMVAWWLIKLLIYMFCIVCDLSSRLIIKLKSRNSDKANGNDQNPRHSHNHNMDA